MGVGPSELLVEGEVALRDVVVRPIEAVERSRWDGLMAEHHYLGFRSLVGESVRYVAEVKGRWVALSGWCSGSFKCGVRDRWIGWRPWVQWRRLHLIANQSRFLILPGVRMANLASRVLGLNVRRLSSDWQERHGHGIVVAETFVDPRRFRGTCYRAAGWLELGSTRGYARSAGRYREHGHSKRVWVRVVERELFARLADPAPSADLDREGGRAVALTNRAAESLWEALLQVPDPRKRRGRRHSKTSVLAVSICAVLGGARSLTAIAEAAQRLPQRLLGRLGARKNPKTGRYQAPSEATIRRLLQAVDPQEVEAALGAWLARRVGGDDDVLAVDGKTLRRARGADGLVHLVSVLAAESGAVLGQRQVPATGGEAAAAKQVLDSLPLEGKVLTADALYTQRDLAEFLVEQKRADYCWPVKDNQPTVRDDAEAYFTPGSFPP